MRNFSFVILFLISFILAFIGASRIVGGEFSFVRVEQSLSGSIIETSNNRSFEPKYQKDEDNINFRLMVVTLLSTIFAVFFVYSGFKIDTTVDKVKKAERKILKIEQEARDDLEFSNQLKYAIHYMMSRQYLKAIDALVVLRSEPTTLKDSYKLNSVYYFLAVCSFEQGSKDGDLELVARAVEYVNEAIEDPTHPLKIEIIAKFEQMNT